MIAKASLLFCFVILAACSSSSSSSKDAGDGSSADVPSSDVSPADVPSTIDSSLDGVVMCTYADGGTPGDGGTFNSVCPTGGCPSGTVCVVEIGGVAGGGGEYCAPIPNECHGTATCACMAACVCTSKVGRRPESCSEQNGTIACDNGIR
jgi:hypothetical protein